MQRWSESCLQFHQPYSYLSYQHNYSNIFRAFLFLSLPQSLCGLMYRMICVAWSGSTWTSPWRQQSSQKQSRRAGTSGPGMAALPPSQDRTLSPLARRTASAGFRWEDGMLKNHSQSIAASYVREDTETHHELSVRGQQPCAVRLHLTVLSAQAILHSEPVQLTGQTKNIFCYFYMLIWNVQVFQKQIQTFASCQGVYCISYL